jgi:hypothetical protein
MNVHTKTKVKSDIEFAMEFKMLPILEIARRLFHHSETFEAIHRSRLHRGTNW